MNILDIDFLRKNCQKIHAFGLGFIQLKFSENERLHFYVPEVQLTINEEDIHNHRYSFYSKILKGYLVQYIFSVTAGPGKYIMRDESCSKDRPQSSRDPHTCSVKLITSATMVAGSSYDIDRDTFHRVAAHRCITHITREPKTVYGLLSVGIENHKEYSQVITNIDNPKICPFSVNLPEDQLWEIVERELKDAY